MKTMAPFIVSFLLALHCQSAAADNKITLGAGLGVLYGNSPGVYLGYRPFDRVEIFAAHGLYNRPGIGMQYYLREEQQHFFQPRLSIIYGVNGELEVYNEDKSDEHRELFSGISVGAGTRLAFGRSKRSAINLDVFYRVSDGGRSNRRSELQEQDRLYERRYSGVMPLDAFLGLFSAHRELQLSVGYSFSF